MDLVVSRARNVDSASLVARRAAPTSDRKLHIGPMISDDDIRAATGSGYCIGYRALRSEATLEQMQNYCKSTKALFVPIAKAFTPDDNSRWLLRHYLAVKFASASALMAGSALYAYEHNLMMAVPYFNYYTLLNACRAYVMTAPQMVWDGQKTVEMTHEKVLNCAADYMRNLDPDRRMQWRDQMRKYRDQRTLFSYRFPLSGPDFVGRAALDPTPAIALAQLVAELGALNSECFDAVLEKHVDENIAVSDLDDHDLARLYKLAGEDEADYADLHRFGKLRRHWRRVSPLHVLVSDGMMDDLFGSWTNPDQEDDDGGFNPDECSNLILLF